MLSTAFANFKEDIELKPMISEEEIKSKILEIAKVIDEEYRDKELVIVLALKGSIIFAADLIREIKIPFSIETVSCSSYGENITSGDVRMSGLEGMDIESKDVLFIDDIFDSGKTLNKAMKAIYEKNPKSVKSLVLLLKKTPHRIEDKFFPDYYLFEIEDKFVIGYGLDYKEYFRGLKGIYYVE
jgi:hypoxanthine phosphoribosyltransferase